MDRAVAILWWLTLWLRDWKPYLLALGYFGLILCFQPSWHLGDGLNRRWLHRLIYDDDDWAAISLRALNSERGRPPGAQTDPCYAPPASRPPLAFLDNTQPLRPQYFLEYPNPVVWMFRAGFLFVPDMKNRLIRPAILDGCQWDFDYYVPAPPEIATWHGIRRLIQVYEAAMLLCLLLLIAALRSGYESGASLVAPCLLLMLPAFLYFSLNRFDILPSLLTALSLACLGRQRISASAGLLAAAVSVKVYPVFLAPLILRHLSGNWKRAAMWIAFFAATVIVFLSLSLLTVGVSGTVAPFRYQLSRSLEGHTIYGSILPHVLGEKRWGFLRLAAVLLTIAAMAWKPILHIPSLLRRSAIVLIVFISLQVFFSPQWIIWLTPLLAPLASLRRSLVPWLIALDVCMFLSFPLILLNRHFIRFDLSATYLRFALSAAIVSLLLRWDRQEQRAVLSPANPARAL